MNEPHFLQWSLFQPNTVDLRRSISRGNRFHMERADEETGEPSGGAAIRSRLSNRADPFLVVCRCFSFVTSLIAILCVVVNVLAAIRSFRDSHDVNRNLPLSLSLSHSLMIFVVWSLFLIIFSCSMEYSGVMLWWLLVLWFSLRQNGVSSSNFQRLVSL